MALLPGPPEQSPEEALAAGPQELQQVLSIDQIRAIRATNDYVERPASLKPAAPASSPVQKQEAVQGLLTAPGLQDTHPGQPQPPLSHSSTTSSISHSTTASEQHLLGGLTPSHSGQPSIRTQPQVGAQEPLKAPPEKPPAAPHAGGHLLLLCEACGHCKCPHCAASRRLPSCWLCNQRCLCSPETLLDYGTCLCCVKGLFYHCSSDDEDTCADDPCACGPGARCAHWVAMGLLSLLMPCLCCYLPTLGCLTLCQRGYDAVKRPGCRCRSPTNTVRRKASAASSPAALPKTPDKPV